MIMNSTLKQNLAEQQQYYNERATQYDDWWEFKGEFEQGDAIKNEALLNRDSFYNYFSKITQSNDKLSVLECASGTGNFTKLFLNNRFKLQCEEGSLQMIDVLKGKFEKEIKEMGEDFKINQTDLFSDEFEPTENTYDLVFMGFLISHIPPTLFNQFFGKCMKSLKPNGRLVFLDSYYHKSYKHKVHEKTKNAIKLDDNLKDDDYIIERNLLDGKTFKIYKICFTAESIMNCLSSVGMVMQNNDSVIINSTYIFGSYSKPSTSSN